MELTANNSYIVDIIEFTDDERVKKKILKAELKNNPKVSDSIIVNIVAPAIRSTEKTGDFSHLFFKTSDGFYLSLENDDFAIEED